MPGDRVRPEDGPGVSARDWIAVVGLAAIAAVVTIALACLRYLRNHPNGRRR